MRIILIIITLSLCTSALSSASYDNYGSTDPVPRETVIFDNYGNTQGSINKEGEVFDNYGNRKGKFREDGTLFDNYGNPVLKVEPKRKLKY